MDNKMNNCICGHSKESHENRPEGEIGCQDCSCVKFREVEFDSRIETYKHIQTVQKYLLEVITNLSKRLLVHDQSKLNSPEKEVFDEYTPKLGKSTYGSEEYKSFLIGMKPALDHHYANNDHHPEFHKCLECNICFKRFPIDYKGTCEQCLNGQFTVTFDISQMSLLCLIEMLCDWKAATMRHANGDLRRSIEINQKRFGYNDQLKSILIATAKEINHSCTCE